MYDAYTRIFSRMGLKFRAVQADGGSIGGDVSQEFHVLADSGEDAIVFSTAATTPPTWRLRRLWRPPRRAPAAAEPLDQGGDAERAAPLPTRGLPRNRCRSAA